MSLKLSIKLDKGTLKRYLEQIARVAGDKEEMHREISEEVADLIGAHLLAKYVPRDKNGVDFWADVRNSIEASGSPKEALVTLEEIGLRLRFYGGDVTPGKSISSYTGKLTRALSVPSKDVPAEGGRQIRPGRAGLLAFIRSATRGGNLVGTLVEGMEVPITRGKKKGQKRIVPRPGGKLMYTLKTITRHKGDKKIIPPEEKLREASVRAILNLLDALD